MIKVLHVLTRLIRGGADEAVVLLVAGLQKHAFEVRLLIGGDSDPNFVEQISQTSAVYLEPSLRRNIAPLHDMRALYHLTRLIRQEAYDVIHTHTAKAGFLGRLAAKLARAPCIVHTVHGITFHPHRPLLERSLYLSFEKLIAPLTDRFIAVGDDLRRYYLEHGVGHEAQYTTIHTGMPLERFRDAGKLPKDHLQKIYQELHIAPTEKVIGHVSRLEAGKGQEFLLLAASQILNADPHVKFVFAGDGTLRGQLERSACELNIAESVIFTGFRHDIEYIMAMFDIAVFPSLWEGLPRVIVQYMAVGKPVVAFDIAGVTELIKDGVNGFTVPGKDVERLAERIIYLLRNPALAQKMGRAGERLLDESWDVEVMVSQVIKEYKTLLEHKEYERNQNFCQ